MAALAENHDSDPGFQIAPMVDVVFVLLLFFMASVGSQLITKEISVKTPLHGSADHPTIIIDITEDGRVLLNSQPLGDSKDRQLPALRDWFKGVIQSFGNHDAVLIRPAPQVSYQRIIDVLDVVNATGVPNVGFL